MHDERTLSEVYFSCEEAGSFVPLLRIDMARVKAMLKIAQMDYCSARGLARVASAGDGRWNDVFGLYYDVLHLLIEAYVRLDKVKARTHECLFSYVCKIHLELELDWDFLDGIRQKRNGSLYYGRPVAHEDWKELESRMEVAICTIRAAVENVCSVSGA